MTASPTPEAARHPSSTKQPFSRELAWFLLIACVTTILAATRIAESDIWYHLRNAREIVQGGMVPRVDIYTFTSAGSPLVDYEWLSELVYLFAFERWGQHGLLAVYTVLLIVSYWSVYRLACQRGANPMAAALITAFGVVLGSFSFGPRMMHFGWMCLVLVMLILDGAERRPAMLWLLPPLFCLWINLHGSWPFGFVVMGAAIVDGLVRSRFRRLEGNAWSHRRLAGAVAAAATSVAALFVNPYGFPLVLYPFDLRFRQEYAVSVVYEWGALDFRTLYGRLALVMIAGLVAVAWRSKKVWRIRDVLLVCFALWAALTYQRFLGFASLVLIPIVALHVRGWQSIRTPVLDAFLSLAFAFVLSRSVPSRATLDQHIDRQFPRDALAFMEREGINGRLFNLFDFGGYIEWHAPQLKTFADGRADIFTYNGVLRDYMDAIWAGRTFEVLDKYRIEYVLIPPNGVVSSALRQSAEWRVVFSDEVAILFERRSKGTSRRQRTVRGDGLTDEWLSVPLAEPSAPRVSASAAGSREQGNSRSTWS